MLINTTLSVPLSKQSLLWFHQSKLSLSSLSVLIEARSHNLLWLTVSHWGPEVWKYQFQFTKRSFAACRTLPSSALFAKQLEECQEDFGRDNF